MVENSSVLPFFHGCFHAPVMKMQWTLSNSNGELPVLLRLSTSYSALSLNLTFILQLIFTIHMLQVVNSLSEHIDVLPKVLMVEMYPFYYHL